MRAFRRFPRPHAARGPRARAWLALVALLAPLLVQASHRSAPLGVVAWDRSDPLHALAASDASAAAAPHDAHGCPLCRAAGHSRLALRVAHAVGAPAAEPSAPRLRPSGALRAPAAPALGGHRSRAPPAPPLLQPV